MAVSSQAAPHQLFNLNSFYNYFKFNNYLLTLLLIYYADVKSLWYNIGYTYYNLTHENNEYIRFKRFLLAAQFYTTNNW